MDGKNDSVKEIQRALTPPQCNYCGSVINAHQAISPGHCGKENCFLAHIERGQSVLKARREQDYRERQNIARKAIPKALSYAAKKHRVAENNLVVAVVPFQNAQVAPSSEVERTAFEAHLHNVVDAAFATEKDASLLFNYNQNLEPEPAIVVAGCATCQGSCCSRGGGEQHAFITRQSVCYVLERQPELTRDDVIAHYLSALPAQSVVAACLFQGAQGCTLAREWRAGICNTFHCHDLYALHDLTDGRSDAPLVLVGIEDDIPGSVSMFNAHRGWERIV